MEITYLKGKDRPPLNPISDKKAVDKLIQEGVRTASPAYFWTSTHATPLPICFQVFKPGDALLKIIRSEKLNSDLLKKPHECFFNLSLLKANLFFKTPFLGLEQDSILFQAPHIAFQIQRRQTVRVPPTEVELFRVTFQHPLNTQIRLHRVVWEIGVGGLSFVVPNSEKNLFHHNQKLKNFFFILNRKKEIQCQAVVRHIKSHLPSSDTKEWRVGVQFLSLPPEDQEIISDYTSEKCRKYFSELEY